LLLKPLGFNDFELFVLVERMLGRPKQFKEIGVPVVGRLLGMVGVEVGVADGAEQRGLGHGGVLLHLESRGGVEAVGCVGQRHHLGAVLHLQTLDFIGRVYETCWTNTVCIALFSN